MTTVSVIIPCYGQADFLADAVASLIAQTRRPNEIVVTVGDPDSEDMAGRLAMQSPVPIEIINDRARGLANARNVAIVWSWGDLILPLDADDVLAPTFLEETTALLGVREPNAIVSTNMEEFGDRRGHWDLAPFDPTTIVESNQLCYASLFRRELWNQVGGYDPAASNEDWEFWVRCAKHRPTVRHVPKRLLRYRVHAASSSFCPEFPGAMRAIVRLLNPDGATAEQLEAARGAVRRMPDSGKAILRRRLQWFPNNPGLRMLNALAGKESR